MTSDLLTVIGSITTATRLKRELETQQIQARVVHTPSELGNKGCSYSVKTKNSALPKIIEYIDKYNLKIKGFYLVEVTKRGEVYHDIS